MGIQSLEMPHPKQIPFKANVIVTSKMQIYICDTRIWFFKNYLFYYYLKKPRDIVGIPVLTFQIYLDIPNYYCAVQRYLCMYDFF